MATKRKAEVSPGREPGDRRAAEPRDAANARLCCRRRVAPLTRRGKPGASPPSAVLSGGLRLRLTFPLPPSAFRLRLGVTLIELLVVVVIISILAASVMRGLSSVNQLAREARTKATIAKIDQFIEMKIESYKTRRVPFNTMSLSPSAAATARLYMIRDLMRMEMPDCSADITTGWSQATQNCFSGVNVPTPGLNALYKSITGSSVGSPNDSTNKNAIISAKCLFLTVMTGNAEAREQFQENEFTVDTDKLGYFIDGWQRPIAWIRWPVGCGPRVPPPGASGTGTPSTGIPISDIQSGNPKTDHDPFDPLDFDVGAFQCIPLIVSSAGHTMTVLGKSTYDYGVLPGTTLPTVTPFDGNNNAASTVKTTSAIPIHNHHIEQR